MVSPTRQRAAGDDSQLSQPTSDFHLDRGLRMPMRDGTLLAFDMLMPGGTGKYPTILIRTPYGRGKAIADGALFAQCGYVVLAQDCRGCGESKGLWDPMVHEREDGADTVDWIAKQPWSNGRVGMIGGSYMGYTQWAAAVEHPAALKCIVPQVSLADAFTNVPYDAGVPMLYSGLQWANVLENLKGKPLEMIRPEGLSALPLGHVDQAVFGHPVDLYRRWLGRDTMEKWGGYDIMADVGKVTIPSLSISGWWDGDEIATQLIWQARREAGMKNQWLIYGPWTHEFDTSTKLGSIDFGDRALLELSPLYLRWFDTWLKGKHVGWEKEPKVRAFFMGENEWHALQDWPDEDDGLRSTLYLGAKEPANGLRGGGMLGYEPREQPPDQYAYDPALVRIPDVLQPGNRAVPEALAYEPDPKRDDYLIFRTEPMTMPTTIAGPISLDLYFSTSAVDTDFFAFLVDEDKSGKMTFLDQPGKIRASFLRSFHRRELVLPGKVYKATIKLWDTATTLAPGHRLGLVITSKMFPEYARNLNTGEPDLTGTRMAVARQAIYHDKRHPSALHFQVYPF